MSFYAGGNDTTEEDLEAFIAGQVRELVRSEEFADNVYDHTHEILVERTETIDDAGTTFELLSDNYHILIEVAVIGKQK